MIYLSNKTLDGVTPIKQKEFDNNSTAEFLKAFKGVSNQQLFPKKMERFVKFVNEGYDFMTLHKHIPENQQGEVAGDFGYFCDTLARIYLLHKDEYKPRYKYDAELKSAYDAMSNDERIIVAKAIKQLRDIMNVFYVNNYKRPRPTFLNKVEVNNLLTKNLRNIAPEIFR